MNLGKFKLWGSGSPGQGAESRSCESAQAAAGTPAPVETEPQGEFPPAARELLLSLARRALEGLVRHAPAPEVSTEILPPLLLLKRGCFVTLTSGKELRGCIGNVIPRDPLYLAVMENARAAASRDPRFPPVAVDELPRVRLEISVLTSPEEVRFESGDQLLEFLRPREHGVVLRVGPRVATFLPQVWAHLPDKAAFLDQLSRKAGADPLAWRRGEASVAVYRAEKFEETDFPPSPGPAGVE